MNSERSENDVSTLRPTEPAEPSFARRRSLKREVIARQHEHWESGNPDTLAHLFELWPDDPDHDPDTASLLLEDFLERKRHGEEPRLVEYQERFPHHEKSLAALVSLRSIAGPEVSAARTLRLPGAGVEIFGFRLITPLGSGAFASAWLSEQASLAGRHVVLKISAIEGDEPQTLAQLQHTSIVPIYSVHEDQAAGLRAVCMPFFGGSNLASVLRQLWQTSSRPQWGSEFVESLKAAADVDVKHGSETRAGPVTEPANDVASHAEGLTPVSLLRGFSYFQTAAWVIAQLADGLQHAHNRGILHRDIKPSNILITSEGQPLLLDFNLSQVQQTSAAQNMLGGTIAYMAPDPRKNTPGHLAAELHLGLTGDLDPVIAGFLTEPAGLTVRRGRLGGW